MLISGCAGSPSLWVGSLWLWGACALWGSTPAPDSRASAAGGLGSCDSWAQWLWPMGALWLTCPVAAESSWTRNRTNDPCTGRWILISCATREVQSFLPLNTVSVLTSTCLMLTQPLQLLFAYCLYVRSVPLLLLSTNLCFYLKRHLFRQHVAGSSFIFLDTVFQFLFCCCCILRYNYHCGGFMSIICYF